MNTSTGTSRGLFVFKHSLSLYNSVRVHYYQKIWLENMNYLIITIHDIIISFLIRSLSFTKSHKYMYPHSHKVTQFITLWQRTNFHTGHDISRTNEYSFDLQTTCLIEVSMWVIYAISNQKINKTATQRNIFDKNCSSPCWGVPGVAVTKTEN